MKYAHINNEGKILGWYDKEINGVYVQAEGSVEEGYYDVSSIPTPNVEVEDSVWESAILINANHLIDGEFVFIDSISSEELEKQLKKVNKKALLDSIVVTTANGNTFDGNESARVNMLSAILSSQYSGVAEEVWKLADNSEVLIGIEELKEALYKSIQVVGLIVKEEIE